MGGGSSQHCFVRFDCFSSSGDASESKPNRWRSWAPLGSRLGGEAETRNEDLRPRREPETRTRNEGPERETRDEDPAQNQHEKSMQKFEKGRYVGAGLEAFSAAMSVLSALAMSAVLGATYARVGGGGGSGSR